MHGWAAESLGKRPQMTSWLSMHLRESPSVQVWGAADGGGGREAEERRRASVGGEGLGVRELGQWRCAYWHT